MIDPKPYIEECSRLRVYFFLNRPAGAESAILRLVEEFEWDPPCRIK